MKSNPTWLIVVIALACLAIIVWPRGEQPAPPGPEPLEPIPVNLLERAGNSFVEGTVQVFIEEAAWIDEQLASERKISQDDVEKRLRGKLRIVIETATHPVMTDAFDRSIVTDRDGNESWDAAKMAQILRELAE